MCGEIKRTTERLSCGPVNAVVRQSRGAAASGGEDVALGFWLLTNGGAAAAAKGRVG